MISNDVAGTFPIVSKSYKDTKTVLKKSDYKLPLFINPQILFFYQVCDIQVQIHVTNNNNNNNVHFVLA